MDQSITAAAAGQGGVPRPADAGREAEAPNPEANVVQVVVGAIPRQPSGFLPRPALIARLNQASRRTPVANVLTGPPGVGKTQVAAAYARAKLADGWRLVAWVNAGDAGSLRVGLAAVADAAGVSSRGSGADPAEAGRAVRRLLEADGERRLLVFDDVDDADLVQPFVPASGAAHVLVTSRRSAVNPGTCIPVGVFGAEEAQAFLAGRTGLGEAGTAPVAAALGFLPLALAQAAGVIAGQKLRYRGYLRRLEALWLEEYLSPEQAQPYPRGVAESVLLSLDAVQRADQTGVSSRVMAIMALLSAAGVRRELLHATGQAGGLTVGREPVPADEVDRVLDALAERSLVSLSLDGRTVLAHRLTARVVREALARYGRLSLVSEVAAVVLEAYWHASAGPRDHRAAEEIPEQVAALLDIAAGLPDAADRELAGAALRLRFLALSGLIERGDSAQAITLGQQLTVQLERALGRDHPETLQARSSLAAVYQAAGQPTRAIPEFELALAARERVLGPDHPDSMRTRSELASAYRQSGQVVRAIPLVEHLLASRERLLGAEHPKTLRARNNLAAAYKDAGRAAVAIPLLEQTLAACERVLGPDDPRTQATRDNLAAARREASRAE